MRKYSFFYILILFFSCKSPAQESNNVINFTDSLSKSELKKDTLSYWLNDSRFITKHNKFSFQSDDSIYLFDTKLLKIIFRIRSNYFNLDEEGRLNTELLFVTKDKIITFSNAFKLQVWDINSSKLLFKFKLPNENNKQEFTVGFGRDAMERLQLLADDTTIVCYGNKVVANYNIYTGETKYFKANEYYSQQNSNYYKVKTDSQNKNLFIYKNNVKISEVRDSILKKNILSNSIMNGTSMTDNFWCYFDDAINKSQFYITYKILSDSEKMMYVFDRLKSNIPLIATYKFRQQNIDHCTNTVECVLNNKLLALFSNQIAGLGSNFTSFTKLVLFDPFTQKTQSEINIPSSYQNYASSKKLDRIIFYNIIEPNERNNRTGGDHRIEDLKKDSPLLIYDLAHPSLPIKEIKNQYVIGLKKPMNTYAQFNMNEYNQVINDNGYFLTSNYSDTTFLWNIYDMRQPKILLNAQGCFLNKESDFVYGEINGKYILYDIKNSKFNYLSLDEIIKNK